MTSTSVVEEAADWLEGLGCVIETRPDGTHHRLVVHHDVQMHDNVSRVATVVDPASSEVRDA